MRGSAISLLLTLGVCGAIPEDLASVVRKASDNVVRVNEQQYNRFLLTKRRDFAAFVLFTASNPKYGCKKCDDYESEFRLVAKSYRTAARESKGPPGENEVVFVLVDYDEKTQRIFGKYQFSTVPVMIHVPAQLSLGDGSMEGVGPYDKYSGNAEAEAMVQFLANKAGTSFEVRRSAVLVYVFLVVFMGAMMLSARHIISNLPWIMGYVRNKQLWMIVCATAYTCSISGFVYDIIRSPLPFHANPRSGEITFFHPQSNAQFVVEGFIIGALNVACSVVLIVLVQGISPIKSKSVRNNSGFIAVVLFAALFYTIITLYRSKNRWYRFLG